MSVRLTELAHSREFKLNSHDSEATFHYVALASADETDPENAVYVSLAVNAPIVWNGLVRMSPSATPLGGGFYQAQVHYGIPQGGDAADPLAPAPPPPPPGIPPPPPPPPTPTPPTPETFIGLEVSLEIAGQPLRVTQSRLTFDSQTGADSAIDAPDYKGAIGVTADGKVEGVDILAPRADLTITKRFPNGVTYAYLDKLMELTGRTNNGPWWVWGYAEVLFLGASVGTDRDGAAAGAAVITYRFAISKTELDIVIPAIDGDITIAEKPGWFYLWIKYATRLDATAGLDVELPLAAYVEQVYPLADFAELGLG